MAFELMLQAAEVETWLPQQMKDWHDFNIAIATCIEEYFPEVTPETATQYWRLVLRTASLTIAKLRQG